MSAQELCLRLVRAESEEEAIRILDETGYWNNERLWRAYGDQENNWGTIGGQQELAEAALVEKITNSVDAMLMSGCLEKGIDPEDENEAPASAGQAAELFFGIRDGLLTRTTKEARAELAESILLVATGRKGEKKPNYIIIDKGEGQSPSKFPETFLSLAKSNKVRIPFVHGRYNMGSTGVLPFCGENSLQLIVSKRNPAIACREKSDPCSTQWGFTVVRRFDPTGTMKNSVLKYLAPGGEVLRFEADCLHVLPGDYPEAYVKPLEWGTLVKMYSYQIRPQYTSPATLDLYYRLSLMLAKTPLPIRVYERRPGYSGHTLSTIISGLTVRLEEDYAAKIEEGFPSGGDFPVAGQMLPYNIFAFKEDDPKKRLASREGIVFLLGGQMQGSIPTTFYKRESVGMSYLANSLLITVECDNLNRSTTEKLFMTSRDRLRDIPVKSEIEKQLEKLVKEHKGLRELQHRRRNEAIGRLIGDSKPLKDILQKVIKKSPALASLLIPGTKLHNPFDLRPVRTQEKFRGKTFPEYFKLIGDHERECPINRRFRVQFETDVENDYFTRDMYRGTFTLCVDGSPISSYTLNLWNGIANLNISLPTDASIGSLFHYRADVSYEGQVEPLGDDFAVRVIDPVQRSAGTPGERVRPPGPEGKGNRKAPSGLELPEIHEIGRNQWDDKHNKYSALHIEQSGSGGYDFYVNVDNVYLMSEIKARPKKNEKLIREQFKVALTLVGLALLQADRKENREEDFTILDRIDEYTRLIAPIVIPVINDLGKLLLESEASRAEEEETFDQLPQEYWTD